MANRSWVWRAVALNLAICGAAATPAHADDLSYFEKQIEPFTKKPEFVAAGPAFDAQACMKGKTILSIPVSSANPFTANIEKAMAAAAKKVGFKFTTWENQGQSSQWVQGMDTAVNQKVNLIDLLAGTDPRVLVPQVQAAQAAKIPVVASHYNGVEQTAEVKKYADGDVPIDYAKAGALLADWAIVKTKGHMNALVLIATGPLSTNSMMSGIEAELKHCDDCKTKVMNFPVVDWGTRITPGVQAALLADPTVNYIIVIYDSMSQFVVPAVTITGRRRELASTPSTARRSSSGSCSRARWKWISARISTGSATRSSTPRCAASAACRSSPIRRSPSISSPRKTRRTPGRRPSSLRVMATPM